MEGRRVERRAPKRNPLYVMFLCLVAAVFVLLLVVIVLGVKLGAANRAVEAAETQVAELQERIATLEKEQDASVPSVGGEEEKLDGEDMPAIDPGTTTPSQSSQQTTKPSQSTQTSKKVTVDWLDLTGHSEVTILPEKLFSSYAVYYATDGVNLRGGPSTGHAKIMLVDQGTQVKAAAKDGDWTFVSVGSKFGWIKSEYLATTPPAEATAGSLRTN